MGAINKKFRSFIRNAEFFSRRTGPVAITANNIAEVLGYAPLSAITKAMPYGAMACSALSLVNTIAVVRNKSMPGSVDFDAYDLTEATAALAVLKYSYDALLTGSTSIFYYGLAISAGVKCVQSLCYYLEAKSYDDSSKSKYSLRSLQRARSNLILSACELAGWSLLAMGQPIGLAFLAITSLNYLAHLKQYYAPNLFSNVASFFSQTFSTSTRDGEWDYSANPTSARI